MLNKKEKQQYTKEDNNFFDTLSEFKKNYNEHQINIIQNTNKIEGKYTINDHNNFDKIIKNHDSDIADHILNYNSQKIKESDYSKNDLKNFEKIDNQVYGYEYRNDNSKDLIKSKKISQINYKKNDLENFNQIINNEEFKEKDSVKIINEYKGISAKLKNENLNLKKIKILYFD